MWKKLATILSPTFLILALVLAAPSTPYPYPSNLHRIDYPNPEPCHGNCTWVHDPSIIKRNDTYWRFTTSGNIGIHTAPSISGPWTYKGAVLVDGPNFRVHPRQDVWAPSITQINSTYYLYYSLSSMGIQHSAIGVATSTALESLSWTDHGRLNVPESPRYNLIDPQLFLDPDDAQSPHYFTFGSYWEGIFLTTLTDPPLQVVSKDLSVPGAYTNVARNSTVGAAVTEGAFTFKYDGWWYLFFSSGLCCQEPPALARGGDEYRVVVCRSEDVKGPYVDDQGRDCARENGGRVVLKTHGEVYAPGGQGVMLIEEEERRPVMYYHYVNSTIGYKADQFMFGWNYLSFESGWPVVVRK